MSRKKSDGTRRPPPPADAVARAEAAQSEAAAELRERLDRFVDPKDRAVFVAVARERFAQPKRVRLAWLAAPMAAAAAALLVLFIASTPKEIETPATPARSDLTIASVSETTLVAPDGELHSAQPGTSILPSSVVETGAGGGAVLRDARTASMTIRPATRLRVSTWTRDEAVVELEDGGVRSSVRKRNADQLFEIHTPYAVVRVVGTEFTVTHTPGESTDIETHEGVVEVETLDGRPLGSVAAGETLRVEGPRPVAMLAPTPEEDGEDEDRASAPEPRQAEAEEVEHEVAEVAATEDADALPARPTPGAEMGTTAPAPPPASPRHTRPATTRKPRSTRKPVAGATLGAPMGGPQPTGGMELGAPESAVVDAEPTAPATQPEPGLSGPEPVAPAQPTAAEVVTEARALLAAGNDAEAIATLESAADRSWRVRATLGDAYRIAGRSGEARAAYEQALRDAGDSAPESLVADLASLLSQSDGAAAAETWERYLDEWPTGPAAVTALWTLAERAARQGDSDEAREAYERLLRDHSRDRRATRALARLGRILIQDGDWDAAEELFLSHRGAERAAASETALVGLLRVRIQQRRFGDARRLVAEHGERFPQGRRSAEVKHLAAAIPDAVPAP